MKIDMDEAKLISEYMEANPIKVYKNIATLWPVLEKIHKECRSNPIYLNQWLVIAGGLYSINFDVIYNGVVSYIKFHNNLKTINNGK